MQTAVYQNPDARREDRVADLLARMSPADKIGQLNMPCPLVFGDSNTERLATCGPLAAGTGRSGVGPIGGFFSLLEYAGPTVAEQRDAIAELQQIARHDTELGIPLLFVDEGTHGVRAPGATIYPEGPALGSTWDPALIETMFAAIASEARALGTRALGTLVVEPMRDPRIGRNQECFSEDQRLCSDMATAVVRGLQDHGPTVVAILCHFPGQSEGASGLERGAMPITERTLREVFLPPWEAGITHTGALGVMATYAAVDGVPTHGSKRILTEILRDELAFEGLVFGEGSGLESLIYEEVVGSAQEAGLRALHAGLDVSIWFEPGYLTDLSTAASKDPAVMRLVDRSVARVLDLKFRLGLFDAQTPARHDASLWAPGLALETARAATVLLKNEAALLPLDRSIGSIAVIGPNADNARNLLGDYVTKRPQQEIITVLAGIRSLAPTGTTVRYAKGCDVVGPEAGGIAEAVFIAADSDVAIVVVGENGWRSPQVRTDAAGGPVYTQPPTNGEGYDAATLELTGAQADLVHRVAATGTPVVLVLVNGRPLAIPGEVAVARAVVESWIPGERGGLAVAQILFGHAEPGGRLPVTVPRHAGQLPIYYNHHKSRRYWIDDGWINTAYVDLSPEPLFPFGFGLTYTSFGVSDLVCEPNTIAAEAQTTVRATVTNTGERKGSAVVQFYQRDTLSSVTTPEKRLIGYARVLLDPGESRRVAVVVGERELSLIDGECVRRVEPGEFEIQVGLDSQNIAARTTLTVTGSEE